MKQPGEDKINENYLRLSGSAVLEKPINSEKIYLIQTEIEINDINLKDRKDETWDRYYLAKIKGLIAIKSEKEKPIIAIRKDKFTPAQLTRYQIEIYHDQHCGDIGYEFIHHDKEEFYKQFHQKLRNQLPNIARLLFTNP